MAEEVRPAAGVGRRALVAGAAWAVPAVAMTAVAPAMAASKGSAVVFGTGTQSSSMDVPIACGRTVTFTVIGGGGGGGNGGGNTWTGGDADRFTGTFVIPCTTCPGGATVTITAAGGGAKGLRSALPNPPSPNFASGGMGYGDGGDSGNVGSTPPNSTDYYIESGINANFEYGGGGGGGSAITLGGVPLIVAGGGGGGGTAVALDNYTNGGTHPTYTITPIPLGGDADPGTTPFLNGNNVKDTVNLTGSTINGQYCEAFGGLGAIGATPGAGGALASPGSTFNKACVIDNQDLVTYCPPDYVLKAGVDGSGPSGTGGDGGDGVSGSQAWPGPAGATRGVYISVGSPGGGGGYAGGGSGGLSMGSSGRLVSGTAGTTGSSVARLSMGVSGGGGAGSWYKGSGTIGCVQVLTATGPLVPTVAPALLSQYGSGGLGTSGGQAGTPGEPGYVSLSW